MAGQPSTQKPPAGACALRADELEAVLAEVLVEREDAPHPPTTHELEADPVDKADVASGRRERRREGLAMNISIDPDLLHDGHEGIAQHRDSFEPQASLGERHRLEHDIVVGEQSLLIRQESLERATRYDVRLVGPVEQRVER